MNIEDENILNCYKFGSHVYGTQNESSDEDFICVVKNPINSENNNIHFYTIEMFQTLLNNCEIQMLECYFLDKNFILKENYVFDFELNLSKLRTSISTITSNSFVKGKKKLIVSGDYDLNIGLKSVFHSLRILDFGIQIASQGLIYDYKSMNYVLEDIYKMSENYERIDLWNKINEKYKPIFNKKSSIFKELAPKDLNERGRRNQIIEILNTFGVYSDELLEALLMLN